MKPLRVVLIVNDYEPHLYALSRSIQQLGFAVKTAASGHDALTGANEHPDVILLDVGLPDIIGFEVCRRLKANPDTASIPVIFISAVHFSEDSIIRGEAAGGSDFLFYPVNPEDLLAVIEGSIARVARKL